MNTKTNAPAAVAQLDKGADKSPKQTTVQTVQANKPASNAANNKGTEVATAEKTPALTHKAELAELVSERQKLGVKIGDGTATAEDFDKVREIADKIKALTDNRAKSLAGLKAQVVSLGLEPLDLFETTQVKQAYSELFPQAVKSTRGAKKGGTRTPKDTSAGILIEAKAEGAKRAATWVIGQKLPASISAAFQALKGKNKGETEKNLQEKVKADQADFVASENGKAEMKRIVDWLHQAA
ncbi:hypothetical protein [Variovorax sp. W2I14]|uniref:hypothetical protein n=1 Tax=Variovorax sp. W2I14 TaxID=3042290 RepID=UPI003D1BEA46